jgi:hypothetical protein
MQENLEHHASPYAPPSASLSQAASPGYQSAEFLALSPTWQRRIILIDRAGGPKLPNLKELEFGERFTVLFNIWAFLFGPFYYLAKGMWRKAVTYTALAIAASFLLAFGMAMAGLDPDSGSNILSFGVATAITRLANVGYYRKVMLSENGWF